MIGSAVNIVVDQGTQRVEVVDTGGFQLHVGPETSGEPKILEISFINGGTQVEAHH